MSAAEDVARLLNLGGVDSSNLEDVIRDYFTEGGGPEDELGKFTFRCNHRNCY